MSRPVLTKRSWAEPGIGSFETKACWESTPSEEGAFVRLDLDDQGEGYLTFTDMEEFDGAYISVPVSSEDFARLMMLILHGREISPYEPEEGSDSPFEEIS